MIAYPDPTVVAFPQCVVPKLIVPGRALPVAFAIAFSFRTIVPFVGITVHFAIEGAIADRLKDVVVDAVTIRIVSHANGIAAAVDEAVGRDLVSV